jgi:hypothetical protein
MVAGATAAGIAAVAADGSGKNSKGDASGRSEGSSGSAGALLLNRKALGLGEYSAVTVMIMRRVLVSRSITQCEPWLLEY